MASKRSSKRLSKKTVSEIAPISEEEAIIEAEDRQLHDELGSDHDNDKDFIPESPQASDNFFDNSDSESETISSWKSKVKKRKKQEIRSGSLPCKIPRISKDKESSNNLLGGQPSTSKKLTILTIDSDESDTNHDTLPDIEDNPSDVVKNPAPKVLKTADIFTGKSKKIGGIVKKPKKVSKQKGKGDTAKKTRKILPLALKLEILDLYLKGGSATKIGNDKGLRESTVRTVIKQKEKIQGKFIRAVIITYTCELQANQIRFIFEFLLRAPRAQRVISVILLVVTLPQLVKRLQNKKGQKNLRYPTKKQSFSLEKE